MVMQQQTKQQENDKATREYQLKLTKIDME
jgi:hypothetical protein